MTALLFSSLLLSSLELSDTNSRRALNTSPPRNRCTNRSREIWITIRLRVRYPAMTSAILWQKSFLFLPVHSAAETKILLQTCAQPCAYEDPRPISWPCVLHEYLAHKETPTPLGLPSGLGRSPTVGFQGGACRMRKVPLYIIPSCISPT